MFRAAISAFCSLPRPSRREIAQLDDLTMPLFDAVPAEALRFAAAALSECEHAPPLLVKRLSESPIETAAPLLVRSRAISEIDLIALIGRHGLPHARAIARRTNLNPAIAALVRALERQTALAMQEGTQVQGHQPGSALEDTRQKLRAMMIKDQANEPNADPYLRLRDTALTSDPAHFHAALSVALGIGMDVARGLTEEAGYASLVTALKALGLSEDKAFLITAAIFSGQFSDPAAISQFLENYRRLQPGTVRETVEGWKGGKTVVVPIRAAQT
ncbi:hypothetical protein BFN67_19550 [Pseudaminobacter manganicus]|uniref:DUF2336 domain-containing protein n=1 Tax=Manganibacter manganicus TaxID=1873176 RepID=A0A1V8RPY3_9HYPH|nr:hypothetical protein BFN67_19550 [Pseudaminobacter manganicus]